jgi:hypothetical protein
LAFYFHILSTMHGQNHIIFFLVLFPRIRLVRIGTVEGSTHEHKENLQYLRLLYFYGYFRKENNPFMELDRP